MKSFLDLSTTLNYVWIEGLQRLLSMSRVKEEKSYSCPVRVGKEATAEGATGLLNPPGLNPLAGTAELTYILNLKIKK